MKEDQMAYDGRRDAGFPAAQIGDAGNGEG